MTEYQYIEMAREQYRQMRKQEQAQDSIPEEEKILSRADRRRQWTLPVTFFLGLVFVFLTNGKSPIQWLALVAYPFCGLRFIDYFIYLTDKYEWLEFNISQTCQQHWQARTAMYCVRVFAAVILMFGASANVSIIGTAPGWFFSNDTEAAAHSDPAAGGSSEATYRQEIILQLPPDDGTGGSASSNGARGATGARSAAPEKTRMGESDR